MRGPRVLAALLALLSAPSPAYEADVHLGLTRWLAVQAGFTGGQADAIALGNMRVDSGLIDTMELSLELVCVGLYADAAAEVQGRHFPSARAVPAPAAERSVVPGSAAARRALDALLPRLAGQEDVLLAKFGAALHPLQDSWSNAGVPAVPEPGAGIACDPAHASAPPAERQGQHPHAAAQTASHPARALAMAAASYEALTRYPPIAGAIRQPTPWAALAPIVERFVAARTKTDKREWFLAQGVQDTGFLRDTSLPDGARPGPLDFERHMLPPLKSAASNQHDAPAGSKAFFDAFFARWLGDEPVEAVVASAAAGSAEPRRAQLAARLKLWKLADHGLAAPLAHLPGPLSAAQLKETERLARRADAFVRPAELRSAFFPLLPKSPHPPPLVPYVVRELPAAPGAAPRIIAITRLRHLPYDTLGLIAERRGEGWSLVEIVGLVDQ